jgi:hypothetical protein
MCYNNNVPEILMETATAFVTPKSKKALNRFHNLMNQIDECTIEQNKGDRVFLRSFNGRNFFWVNLHNDPDWIVDF